MKLLVTAILIVCFYGVAAQSRDTLFNKAKGYYNKGLDYQNGPYDDSAITLYTKLINTSFPDDNYSYGPILSPIGDMYKNWACIDLYDIYLRRKDYKTALSYIYTADTAFRYSSGCGNAGELRAMRMCIYYSRCFEGLGKVDEAIEALMPELFNDEDGDVAIVQRLKEVLPLKYTSKQIRTEIKSSVDKIAIFSCRQYGQENRYPIIPLFGYRMSLGSFTEDGKGIYIGSYMPRDFEAAKQVTDTVRLRAAKDRYLMSKAYRELSAMK